MLLHLYAAGYLPAYGCAPGMPLPLSLLLLSAHLILLIFFLLKYRYERVYKLFQAHLVCDLVFLQLPFDVFLYLLAEIPETSIPNRVPSAAQNDLTEHPAIKPSYVDTVGRNKKHVWIFRRNLGP